MTSRSRMLAVAGLLLAGALALGRAASTAGAITAADTLSHPATVESRPDPELVSTVAPDYPEAALDAKAAGEVQVRALVGPSGRVLSTKIARGVPLLDRAATEAVSWYLFRPAIVSRKPVEAWTTVAVHFEFPKDLEPLLPNDRVGSVAREAEKDGRLQEALDGKLGVLARIGRHPTMRNEWATRADCIRIARSMKPAPPISPFISESYRGQKQQLPRTMATANVEAIIGKLERVTHDAPWWGEPYFTLAQAQATNGHPVEAARALMCWQLAYPDSSARPTVEGFIGTLMRAPAGQIVRFDLR